MHRFAASPALARLEWILDGLDGTPGWGADASDVFAAAFTAAVTPERYVEVTRGRAAHYAPVVVVGLDVGETTARARILRHDGTVDVVTCVVETARPHRIATTWVEGLVPAGLTPGLPADFTDHDLPSAATGARLVVFSGLPGSGKSTLADAAGAELGIPVFATDWLLGALTPFGGRHFEDPLAMAEEVLTTLALRQLLAGQSAILDHPTELVATRERWRSLASRAGAEFRVVECRCSDPRVHRARLEGRSRGIPGWHDSGDWSDVRQRLASFPSWHGEALTVDTVQPHELALAAVLRHITA
ncbi:ATP-binding protein [Lentzea sp. DG1S-22]|uniref:AAA family ATPase n=1 Tax=Lentzea sp. DG1S-22 TaxID=3108822 RepID=UPI002E7764F7|nr:ATP-binding protein [Lentzea sp. DG1S-22]WVH81957.1 ATP-binding protein [Lentzea sp. DG1S-22]